MEDIGEKKLQLAKGMHRTPNKSKVSKKEGVDNKTYDEKGLAIRLTMKGEWHPKRAEAYSNWGGLTGERFVGSCLPAPARGVVSERHWQ